MAARVLIVDDEPNARRVLAIGLRVEGFDVDEASDGNVALERLAVRTADVCFVDLMMPNMNGLELARQLRCHHPAVRVVLTSAYHLSERQLERAGLGPVAFVPKPFDLDALAQFLRAKVAAAA